MFVLPNVLEEDQIKKKIISDAMFINTAPLIFPSTSTDCYESEYFLFSLLDEA